jgi:ABC-type Fe3+-hydroxamate transport system substrate-binding protein
MTEATTKKIVTDQMGFKVTVNYSPKRIISLVPSQTELLFDLGLDEEVVGITKFCVHPENWFRNKTKIGGTKNIDFDKIEKLNPDLIIGNKEENKEEQIKQLMQRYQVWMSDIHNLDDAFEMIRSVGKLVDKYDKAEALAKSISSNFKQLHFHNLPMRKVAYFIWKDPYMSIGRNSFINSMLEVCNFKNVFRDGKNDYPEVSKDEIKSASPEFILLSSEPFPFKEKHIPEFKEVCPEAKILLVDGEYFSWYGSRLLGAPNYFTKLLQEIGNG